ncbi:MAG: cbb3-type cytochrome c oxidase subunit 3 [Gemmatimonadetes bacterium]|nr:cbb3-type cytochrome c oxidase subunit 3 [Gemmatimonadota bacterium]
MSHAGLAIYAEYALVLFMLVFVGIAVWAFWPSNKAKFDADAQLPLDDDFRPAPARARGR